MINLDTVETVARLKTNGKIETLIHYKEHHQTAMDECFYEDIRKQLLPVVPAVAGYLVLYAYSLGGEVEYGQSTVVAWRVNVDSAHPIPLDDSYRDAEIWCVIDPNGQVNGDDDVWECVADWKAYARARLLKGDASE